jgi:hypothetical protein
VKLNEQRGSISVVMRNIADYTRSQNLSFSLFFDFSIFRDVAVARKTPLFTFH